MDSCERINYECSTPQIWEDRMKKKITVLVLMLVGVSIIAVLPAFPEESREDPELWGICLRESLKDSTAEGNILQPEKGREKAGFEVSTGIQGIMSYVQLGFLFPRADNNLFFDLKVKYLSSLTWATYIDQDNNAVSFHPSVIGGAFSFGGYSPLFYDCVRVYGGLDVFLGYSFTPYDSAIRQTGNLIGDNLTYALLGFFGLEFFTSEHISMILDAGGGFKSLIGNKSNQYVIASSWLGSGFGIKMGIRYYL
jgi:hypothetical protein